VTVEDSVTEIPTWQRPRDGLTIAWVHGRWHYVGFTASEREALKRAARRIGAAVIPSPYPEDLALDPAAHVYTFTNALPILDPRTLT